MKKLLILATLALIAGVMALGGGPAQANGATVHCVPNAAIDGSCSDGHATIQAAVDDAATGDTVLIDAGTYNETVTIKAGFSADSVTVTGLDPNNRPAITGGVKFLNTGTINGITFSNLYIKGDAGGMVFDMDNSGVVNDFAMDNCVIDGELTSGLHGFGGQNLAQSFTMTNNEFKDILGWALMDISSGSGDGGNSQPLTTVAFSNNNVHDSNGSVALRGNATTNTTVVNVHGNTWDNIGGNGAETGQQWAAVEVNHAVAANITNNTINDVQLGQWGEGQCMQIWDVDTVDIRSNDCTNNAQGIFIYGDTFGGGPHAVPGGSVTCNNLIGNSAYGLELDAAAIGGPLSAENNWWGFGDGPSGAGAGSGDAVSANVDFDPWDPYFGLSCGGVGGVVDLRSALSDDTGTSYAIALASVIAAAAIVLATGAWYARKRLVR